MTGNEMRLPADLTLFSHLSRPREKFYWYKYLRPGYLSQA
jgi:hypothetical protein